MPCYPQKAANKKRTIRIGSRDSVLAVAQTNLIIDSIQKRHPELTFELVTMKTSGDRGLGKTLDKAGGKGLFVKELDEALRDGRIDLAVHSLKDMPVDNDPALPIVALSERGDPRDALVGALPENGSGLIGTSSARRVLQIQMLFSEKKTAPIRGNILTRLKKLDNGDYSSLILAASGLSRAGLSYRVSRYFSVEEIVPAAGQGILAVQGCSGADYSFLSDVDSEKSRIAAKAERTVTAALGGNCFSPTGAYAHLTGTEISITGFYQNEQTKKCVTASLCGKQHKAQTLAEKLAETLIKESR